MKPRATDLVAQVLKGFCMGAADVVPGVSGGTMAFILGIYTRLIDAIKSFDMTWAIAVVKLDFVTALKRPHFEFLIPLGGGIIAAVIFFTRVVPIPSLIRSHPEHIYGLFFGLILGSIVVLFSTIKSRSLRDIVGLVLGIGIGAMVVSAVPVSTPDAWWFITACGAVAICAMVLPGISGSFILLLLGKYAYILDGIGKFELSILIPFALGAAFGLASFTRVLSWLLHRYEQFMLLVISGFLIASLWVVWPFQVRDYVLVRGKERLLDSLPIIPPMDSTTAQASALMVIGFALVLGANALAKRP